MLHRLILIAAVLFCWNLAGAQEKSNKGKEFWLGYGYNYGFNNEPPVNQQNLVLYLSAEAAATVTVSVNGTGWSQTVSIPANSVNASVLIPKTGPDDARIFNEGLISRGIHIVSDTPIVAYAHLYNTMVSGATMLMPVETYGYKYYSLNYSQNTSAFSPPGATAQTTQNGPDWYSWFYVVASENNTTIQITPSDTTRNGWLPGQTYTVNLNKGEIYNVMGKLGSGNALWAASKDMTGSKILSVPGADGNCHPVAVFCGSSGIRLCKGDGGEYMQQQVFPTQAWGTRYLTHQTMNNTSTNINDGFKNFYRVAVSDPTTIVKRNGVVMTGLINNFYYEYLDSLGGDYIEANKPVLVAQYTPGGNRCYQSSQFAYGDPEMFYLSAMEQGKKDVLFYATRNSFIDYNYLNVVVPTSGIPSLQLDGLPFLPQNIIAHPKLPGYSVAVARMLGAAAQHRLTCDTTFNALVYGLGFFESYGYNVGTFINNLNYYSTIKNSLSTLAVDTITCTNTPVRFFLKVGYSANSIHWKLSQVPGMSPNADSIIANPVPVATEVINGRTYYVYSVQQDFTFSTPGTYYIPVSYSSTVIENCSQTETAQVKVVVRSGPKADFTVPGTTCASDSLQLNGTANANGFNIIGYNWNFDDNTTATGINTKKKFLSAGQHNIKFSIVADNGCSGDTTKTISLLPNPVANFGISSPVCANSPVLFTDSSSISSVQINSWQWIFGDGNVTTASNGNAVSHSYNNGGNIQVALVTTGANGCKSDTAKKALVVYPKPVAKFGYDRNICLGDSIRFTDSSAIVTGSIVQWKWNFGDGNLVANSGPQAIYHKYANTGVYSVSLVVVSASGCVSDTFRLNVSVNTRPSASFTIIGKPCVDSAFTFSSSFPFNAPNPANYYWSFGDGQTVYLNSSNSISHAYTSIQSNIQIKHVVTYGQGCTSDTAVQTIPLLVSNPAAQFSAQPNPVCAGTNVQFTSSVTGPNLSWEWNFGNGPGSAVPPISRAFQNGGSYTVKLVVRTPEGCGSSPFSQTITVNPKPAINAGTDQLISSGSSVVLDASVTNPSAYTFNWTPGTYLNNPNILNPVAKPDTTTVFVITATDPLTGCTSSDSVKVSIIYDIYIPNAFTPNGDGKNDRWMVPGLALYPEAKVSIFNRWGEVVYSTKNYNAHPWDGTMKSVKQGNDSFVYIIEIPGTPPKLFKGTVTIIR